jgi:hypothetical protein
MSDFKKRQELSWEGMFYSIQRIDLLIVSICSAGIYVILETVKFLVERNLNVSWCLKAAGIAFIAGIIINFLSQLCGYKANEQDYLMCELECNDKEVERDQLQIDIYDKKAALFSNLTNKLNYISMGLLTGGLIFLLTYFLISY